MMEPYRPFQRPQVRLNVPAAPIRVHPFLTAPFHRDEQIQPLLGLAPSHAPRDKPPRNRGLRRHTMMFAAIEATGPPYHRTLSLLRNRSPMQFPGARFG